MHTLNRREREYPTTISIVGMMVGGGRNPPKNQLPSGIIHGHLIVLVRHKQAQTCIGNDMECYR